MAYRIGQIVQLRSGGPEMTVAFEDHSGKGLVYKCAWFTADGLLQEGFFPEGALKAISEDGRR